MAHFLSLPMCATDFVLACLAHAGVGAKIQWIQSSPCVQYQNPQQESDTPNRKQQGFPSFTGSRRLFLNGKGRIRSPLETLALLLLTVNPIGFQIIGAGSTGCLTGSSRGCLCAPAHSMDFSMQAVDAANGTLASVMSVSWPEVAVDSLQTDLPDILTRDPNWEHFAKDFKLIDRSGVTLKGLDPNRALLKSLRELHNNLTTATLADNFEVAMERKLEGADGMLESILTAQWNFTIGNDLDVSILQELKDVYFPLLPYVKVLELEHSILPMSDAFPLQVASASTFRFNSEGKVKSMELHSWSINGNELEATEPPSLKELSELEKWLCQKIVRPRALTEEQPSMLGLGPTPQYPSSSVQCSDRFPTVETLPVEVLHAQLSALASGNISQIFSLFSRARRQVIEEKARRSPRQVRVEPERVRKALSEILTSTCPGLLRHRSSNVVESRGDPEPSNGFLPSWRYRVSVDGTRLFIFTLTLAPRGQFGFDGGHPEAYRSDYGYDDPWSEYPGAPETLERCWLVWDITLEGGGGDSRIDVPAPPARRPVLA